MIQTIIIAIPGIAALIQCIRRGPERAFLDVYLPVLLLLPEHSWPISGQLSFADTAVLPIGVFLLFRSELKRKWTPIDLLIIAYVAITVAVGTGEFSFEDTAILPITAFLLFWSKLKWRWNTIDFLVFGYVTITVVAEGMNKGYKLGFQNLALQDSCNILLPYFVAKYLFRRPQFGVDAAKRVVALLAVVAIVSVWEFRMGSDLFTKFFDGIFPFDARTNTIVFRAGFMRTQGPYGHAITLGIMMVIGFRLARWLEWSGEWNERTRLLPISKIRFCELCIAAGSIMSLSVAPWLGAACAAVVVAVCRARNRKRVIVALLVLFALCGPSIFTAFKNYVSVDPFSAIKSGDRLQEDSAYRSQLIPAYTPVVEERPTWGWGRNGFPIVNGMYSIDDAYLFVALTFGLYALGIMVLLFVWPAVQLTIFSFRLAPNDPRALAAFTMIAIYVLNVIVDGTGAGGGAPWNLFFILAGWSAALVNDKAPALVEVEAVTPWPRPQLGFRKVMV